MPHQSLQRDEVHLIAQAGQGKGATETVQAWHPHIGTSCPPLQQVMQPAICETLPLLAHPQRPGFRVAMQSKIAQQFTPRLGT